MVSWRPFLGTWLYFDTSFFLLKKIQQNKYKINISSFFFGFNLKLAFPFVLHAPFVSCLHRSCGICNNDPVRVFGSPGIHIISMKHEQRHVINTLPSEVFEEYDPTLPLCPDREPSAGLGGGFGGYSTSGESKSSQISYTMLISITYNTIRISMSTSKIFNFMIIESNNSQQSYSPQ